MSTTEAPRYASLAFEPEPLTGFSGPDQPPVDVIRRCVKCGFCLPSCPTYRMTQRERSSPRGRINLIKSVTEGRLDLLDPMFLEEMSLCLNCRACEAVCPSGVLYGELLESARAQIVRAQPGPPQARLLRTMAFRGAFGSPRRFRTLSRAMKLYQRSPMQTLVRKSRVLRPLGLEEKEALLPTLSDDFMIPEKERWQAVGERRGTVALLSGCVMSTAYADVHRATARVLARNGWDVVVPGGQECCGALAVHSGDLDSGRRMARANIDAFTRMNVAAVIVDAAGCGAAMKEYDFLLRDDPAYAQKAKRFVSIVKDASEFVAAHEFVAPTREMDVAVTYQEPCHLAHAQRITQQPRQLLSKIPGLKLVEMAESSLCCGSAGIYNLLQPDMSNALLERKLGHALATKVPTIVSANPGCMLQLQAGLRARGEQVNVVHIMSLLDEATNQTPVTVV